MVERVTLGAGAEETYENIGKVQSSADFDAGGVEIRTGQGGFATTVQNASQLDPSDRVTVRGLEMTAAQADQMGLLDEVFGEQTAAVSPASPEATAGEHASADPANHPEAQFNTVVEGLNAHLENGSMDIVEAVEYEAAIGQAALEGLTPTDVANTLQAVEEGEMEPSEIPSETREVIQRTEAKVVEAATQAAMAELGAEGFADLQQLATVHPEVSALIRQYGLERATGQHEGVTWADLHAHVRSQLQLA